MAQPLARIFPASIYDFTIRRLTLVNLVLNLGSLIILYLTLLKATRKTSVAFFGGLFFIFEAANAYNGYAYQSHTTCGIFFYFLALGIYFVRGIERPLDVFLFVSALTWSVLSSTHTFYLCAFLGLFTLFQRKRILYRGLAALLGALPPLLYIFGVELLLDFKKAGIPTWWEQNKAYLAAGVFQRGAIDLSARFLWDLRLINAFAVPMAAILLWIISERFSRCEWKRIDRRLASVLLSGAIALLVTAFSGLPLTRVLAPYAALGSVLLGAYLGNVFSEGKALSRIAVFSMAGLSALSFLLVLGVVSRPETNQSIKTVQLDSQERAMSVSQYLKTHGEKLGDLDKVYVRFDPMELVVTYSPERRFYLSTAAHPNLVVTPATYTWEFRFFAQAFLLLNVPQVSDADFFRRKRTYWPFLWWDQEYNYPVGYLGGVRKFLTGTGLAQVDTHYLYYLNLGALSRIAKEAEPLARN